MLRQHGLTSDAQGRLYVATALGLFIGRPAGREYTFRLIANPWEAGGSPVHGVFLASAGDLWFGCGSAICSLTPNGGTTFGSGPGAPPGRWDAGLRDPQGNLWIRWPQNVRVRRPGAAQCAEGLR